MRNSHTSFSDDLRCPDDGHLLRTERDGGVAFALCRHCDGVWLSRESIENVHPARLPDSAMRRRPATPKPPRACPQCATTFVVLKFDDVEFDRCTNCGGVWLDPGEYHAARKHVAQIRMEKTVPSLAPPRTVLAKTVDWILDFIGWVYIEHPKPDETVEDWQRRKRARRRR